jgi:hypothetical protein
MSEGEFRPGRSKESARNSLTEVLGVSGSDCVADALDGGADFVLDRRSEKDEAGDGEGG